MVQSVWGPKTTCQVPAMNEALEIQEQVGISPGTRFQIKGSW